MTLVGEGRPSSNPSVPPPPTGLLLRQHKVIMSFTDKLEVYDFFNFVILTSALATTHPPTQILTVLGLRKPYEILDDP